MISASLPAFLPIGGGFSYLLWDTYKTHKKENNMPTPRMNPNVLYLIKNKRGAFAIGRPLGNGGKDKRFLVFANSRIARTPTIGLATSPKPHETRFREMRQQFEKFNILKPGSDGATIFAQDFVFETPSAAAALVMGNPSANGYDAWKPLT